MFEGITINGVPLAVVVDEKDREEKRDFRMQEISVMGKTIRTHIRTNTMRNHSGSRSGKCRLVFSAAAGGAQ